MITNAFAFHALLEMKNILTALCHYSEKKELTGFAFKAIKNIFPAGMNKY